MALRKAKLIEDISPGMPGEAVAVLDLLPRQDVPRRHAHHHPARVAADDVRLAAVVEEGGSGVEAGPEVVQLGHGGPAVRARPHHHVHLVRVGRAGAGAINIFKLDGLKTNKSLNFLFTAVGIVYRGFCT